MGVVWALNCGNVIGCPPLVHHGTPEQKHRLLPSIYKGTTRFCLAVTEPGGKSQVYLPSFPGSDFVYEADHPRMVLAGSDVANVTTVAQRQGNKYIVNGEKKWITNGVYADFCTAAVRTGGPGQDGISALIIPLKVTGVTLRRMENSGIHASGTRHGRIF